MEPEEALGALVEVLEEADRDGRAPDQDRKPCRLAAAIKDLKDNQISHSGEFIKMEYQSTFQFKMYSFKSNQSKQSTGG